MDLLLRGKYVLTSAAQRDAGVLTDAAVLVRGDSIEEVGEWHTLRRGHPQARITTPKLKRAGLTHCRGWA